ncbi:MAG: hypothetical protein ACJ76Y_24960, partial [Thermoanaerobaculia bacterium]
SLWRIQQALLGAMAHAILGALKLKELLQRASPLCRYFLDSPRRQRKKQAPRAMKAARELAS